MKLRIAFFLPIIFFSFFLNINTKAVAQESRRHFIIAYDVSTPFKVAEKSNYNYKNALISLLNNVDAVNYSEANLTNLSNEKDNGLKFFDKDRDEISFFQFNVARSEFDRLAKSANNYDANSIVNEFCKVFLKDKHFCWSDFSSNENESVAEFVSQAFSITPNPSDFAGGVSISNFVYPLILTEIDTSKYSEEYILIILSDFLTGSMHGNKMDFDRIKDIYSYSYSKTLPGNSPPNLIKLFTDNLSSAFYKIDYFEFTFNNTINAKPISIIGYKIKPKAGKLNPEDVSIFVDSDLELRQRGYRSKKFKIPESAIKFTHNNHLKLVEVALQISIPHNGSQNTIFSDIIATADNNGKWSSNYTSDDDLMNFNESKCLYFVPELKIEIDTLINRGDFENIRFEYKIRAKYNLENANSLNFIYKTERLLSKENVIFTKKTATIIMTIIIPFLLLISAILILIYIGKPKGMRFRVVGYTDSYEKVDHNKYGKLNTPFKFWNCQSDNLPVYGEVFYKYNKYPFNWKPTVYLELSRIKLPSGFDCFLKPDLNTIKEYAKGNKMPLKQINGRSLNFNIGIRQNDITLVIKEPVYIQIEIFASIYSSFLFFKTGLQEKIDYNFHIGDDLGDIWVGIDPGTTGSCITAGSLSDNIAFCKDTKIKRTNPSIIPSFLTFDTSIDLVQNDGEIPEVVYNYGTLAYAKRDVAKVKFQSIKKLLGYKDVKEIIFKNKQKLLLTGKQLSGILVKGLYKELKTFVAANTDLDFVKSNGSTIQFDPKRAVVAIPNNFTINKIQDIISCFDVLNQFKEIRYVYEAEAVLFYYLNNYDKFNNGNNYIEDETVLVFDMGGATINATVVNVSKIEENNNTVYDINILGKIGYSIGGDTIDYCILKYLENFKNEYPELTNLTSNVNKEIKDKLKDAARVIKMQIVDYFNEGNDFLITTPQLQSYLNIPLGNTIEFSEDSKLFQSLKKNARGTYSIFLNKVFIDLIYNNVRDAVNEVIDLSGVSNISKVIFSGRSTYFPYIKETVEKQIKSKGFDFNKVVFDEDTSKTAVAFGACWYGINKKAVRLHNLKTNSAFGFKHTIGPSMSNVEFLELIEMGHPFDVYNSEIDHIEDSISFSNSFALDGDKVNFFQIMGQDANKILSGNQKHKFSKIASIKLPQPLSLIGMKVYENDNIECMVKLISDQVLVEKGIVSDQDINDANEEHYTWIIN